MTEATIQKGSRNTRFQLQGKEPKRGTSGQRMEEDVSSLCHLQQRGSALSVKSRDLTPQRKHLGAGVTWEPIRTQERVQEFSAEEEGQKEKLQNVSDHDGQTF